MNYDILLSLNSIYNISEKLNNHLVYRKENTNATLIKQSSNKIYTIC